MHETMASIEASTMPTARRMPLREALLLGIYHMRLLNWWLFLLMFLGFLGSCGIFWLTVRSGNPGAIDRGNEFSRFVLETGAGLVAGLLSSFLVVGDPLLELMIATREGIYKVLGWRLLLTLLILLLCSSAYLTWSLSWRAAYTVPQTFFSVLFVWIAPVFTMSMLGLLGSLLTRNAPLGAVIAAVPVMIALFMHSD